MGWFSTLSGGAAGMLLGGPIGGIIGAALGYGLGSDGKDEGPESEQESKQAAFFATFFVTMGYVAKADGRVSDEEVGFVEQWMDDMKLDSEERQFAQDLFRTGKNLFREETFLGSSLNDVLKQFRHAYSDDPDMLNFFIWTLLYVGYADGRIDTRERSAVQNIALKINFSLEEVRNIEAEIRAEEAGTSHRADGSTLEDAYQVLGVSPNASGDEVRQAYRTLMKDYHPDVLASKGLPEEMMKFATQRAREFSRAYECIRQTRNL